MREASAGLAHARRRGPPGTKASWLLPRGRSASPRKGTRHEITVFKSLHFTWGHRGPGWAVTRLTEAQTPRHSWVLAWTGGSRAVPARVARSGTSSSEQPSPRSVASSKAVHCYFSRFGGRGGHVCSTRVSRGPWRGCIGRVADGAGNVQRDISTSSVPASVMALPPCPPCPGPELRGGEGTVGRWVPLPRRGPCGVQKSPQSPPDPHTHRTLLSGHSGPPHIPPGTRTALPLGWPASSLATSDEGLY